MRLKDERCKIKEEMICVLFEMDWSTDCLCSDCCGMQMLTVGRRAHNEKACAREEELALQRAAGRSGRRRLIELESRDANVADDLDILPLFARLVLLHGIVRLALQSKVGNLNKTNNKEKKINKQIKGKAKR